MPWSIKAALARVGPLVSESTVHTLNAMLNYLETGRWLAAHELRSRVRRRTDKELFDLILADVAAERVLYLEFGVYRGESMRYWASKLTHPESALHGFDSFEGLPEHWNIDTRRGHFSTAGALPQIADPRVRFFKGWFSETLPGYVAPPHDRLVVNLDADLYSSTIEALQGIRALIVPGTYLYFDEFADRMNELRAFAEFVEATSLAFTLVAASPALTHVVFRCTANTRDRGATKG